MIGSSFGHYRILAKIGQGGMGEVYLAEDTTLLRRVALKFLPPELADDPDARIRFLVEARAAAALSHPNICVIHEVGIARLDEGTIPPSDPSDRGGQADTAGRPFIALEYLEGRTLEDAVGDEGLSIDRVVDIAIQVLEGLQEAHAHGIVHRDVKSANILVTAKGQAKILDFGLAKVGGAPSVTRVHDTPGTLAYMAPEQASGGPLDARADLWAVGVVLYEMLSGTLPFRGPSDPVVLHHILFEEPGPLENLRQPVPPELRRILARALEKDPARRYSSASEMSRDLRAYQALRTAGTSGVVDLRGLARRLRRPSVLLPTVAGVLAVGALGAWTAHRRAEIHRVRVDVLPVIRTMIEESDLFRDMDEPYRLVQEVERVLGDDPELAELASRVSLAIDVVTEPAGARVHRKPYDQPDAPWTFEGTTPLDGLRVPIDVFRWRIEKDGFDTVFAVASSWDFGPDLNGLVGNPLTRTLDPEGTVPEGMVRVPGGDGPGGTLPDFFIGRHEVTNREFKAFVDAGGYRRPEFWIHVLRDGEKTPSWDETRALLVDRTGLPGPATWEGGSYPPGHEDHPVTGVSWYEAAAYAEWAGRSLPTAEHWAVASGRRTPLLRWYQLGGMTALAPLSNFDQPGPVAVGSRPSLSAYGAFDMAGNAREWCWNEGSAGRVIRGGAWNDNPYAFYNVASLPAMDRSPQNGFRLAHYPDPDAVPEALFDRLAFPEARTLRSEEPVSDEVFRVYTEQFAYDPVPLDARVEARDESPRGWIRERVSYRAAYGDERIVGYLHLPRDVEPPYSVVVYFPGSQALAGGSRGDLEDWLEFNAFLSFLPAAGRAVLYPTYQGTFQRFDPSYVPIHAGAPTRAYSDYAVELVQDFMRSVDYLETRDDIDTSRLAYYGMSWGGWMGTLIPAVDERVRANILLAGGILTNRTVRPEVDPWNYVGRVRQPTLMINGRYDTSLLLDRGIQPVFDALGTPVEQKALRLYETDHIPPRADFIRDILAWLDTYLGSVAHDRCPDPTCS